MACNLQDGKVRITPIEHTHKVVDMDDDLANITQELAHVGSYSAAVGYITELLKKDRSRRLPHIVDLKTNRFVSYVVPADLGAHANP